MKGPGFLLLLLGLALLGHPEPALAAVRAEDGDRINAEETPTLSTTPREAAFRGAEKPAVRLNFFQRLTLRWAKKRLEKQRKKENKFGSIGLILGGAAVLFLLIPYLSALSFFLALAAVVLGIMGIKRDARPARAIIALVLGGGLILLTFIALATVALTL